MRFRIWVLSSHIIFKKLNKFSAATADSKIARKQNKNVQTSPTNSKMSKLNTALLHMNDQTKRIFKSKNFKTKIGKKSAKEENGFKVGL